MKVSSQNTTRDSLEAQRRMLKESIADVERLRKSGEMMGDAYLARFANTIVGAMAPANRQSVGRWLREIKGRKGSALSPYLAEAFGFANELGTPIVLALDLEDATSVDQIRLVLASEPNFEKETGVAIDKAATFLTSIRGVSLIGISGTGMQGIPGIVAKAFDVVAEQQSNVLMISQASSENNICFVLSAAEAPRVRAAFANCGPITTGDHRPIPFLRYLRVSELAIGARLAVLGVLFAAWAAYWNIIPIPGLV